MGKYETGAKTAIPVFSYFIKKSINKLDARPFKVSKDIKMMLIDAKTGKKAARETKDTIIEAFKYKIKEKNFFEGNDELIYNKPNQKIFNFY